MFKFVGGLTLGVIFTSALIYSSKEKIGGVMMGMVVGIILAAISYMAYDIEILDKKIKKKKSDDDEDNWWRKGERPPWEMDEELD